MVVGGVFYSSGHDVSADIRNNNLHGLVMLGPNGSNILVPLRTNENGDLVVDVGSSINVAVGSIIQPSTVQIQDTDTGVKWQLNGSGAGTTAEQLAEDMWTTGGKMTIGAGSSADYDFPFTAQSVLFQFDQDLTFNLKPYTASNQTIEVTSLEAEFRSEGMGVTGLTIDAVGSDTEIQIVAIKALDGTY